MSTRACLFNSSYDIYSLKYQNTMCHGAGAKVGWFKEYCGLTFTMLPCYSDVAQVKGLVNLLPAKTHSCLIN